MITAIRPEAVAAKVAAARRQEAPELAAQFDRDPRLLELLWALQWWSTRPGGLPALVGAMVESSSDLIGPCDLARESSGTGTVVDTASQESRRQSLNKALQAIPDEAREEILGDLAWFFDVEFGGAEILDCSQDKVGRMRSKLQKRLAALTADDIRGVCVRAALDRLPEFFARFCQEPNHRLTDQGFWYFREPVNAMLRYLEGVAARELAKLADTAVKAQILEALDYAWSCRQPVWIHGTPAAGKTETLEAYCRAWPGRARLVAVPASDSDMDLYRAVANALGISYQGNTPAWKIRADISWILSNAHVGILFDESHWLYPSKLTGKATPSRLNWVRTEIVDRDLPCVLCTTPQGQSYADRRFRKVTQYPMEQFTGRWVYRIDLPETPSREDVLTMVHHYFPGAATGLAKELAGRALQHEGQFRAIKAMAVRSDYLARKAGRQKSSVEDIRQAMDELLPKALQIAAAASPQTSRNAAAEPMNEQGDSAHVVRGGIQISRSHQEPRQARQIRPASLVPG